MTERMEQGETKARQRPLFSVVVPVYRNEMNIADTVEYIYAHRDLFAEYRLELVMVNDGSPDASWEKMKELQRKYPEFLKIATLVRNFGQSAAINCGMVLSKGDVIGVISADLQDPFELFQEMLIHWRQGNKLVYAYREGREETGLSAKLSRLMHAIVRKFVNQSYPRGGFDFFLADRELVDQYLEADRIPGGMQLLLLWFGYSHVAIPYTRARRKKGKSSWSIRKKINAAFRWITLYSDFLLRGMLLISAVIVLIGIALMIVSVVRASVAGLAFSIGLLMTGIVLAALGVLGEYISRILEYEMALPRYVLGEVIDQTR